jgi:hypothetical protein
MPKRIRATSPGRKPQFTAKSIATALTRDELALEIARDNP